MSGGGGSTSSTVTQSNIPDWLRPQAEMLLGGATQELFSTRQSGTDAEGNPLYEITGTRPYVAYGTPTGSVNPATGQPYTPNEIAQIQSQAAVAGFSPLQTQVQANVANLQVPGQFNQATGMAGAAGAGALGSALTAANYGTLGQQAGAYGQQLGTQQGGYYGGMGAGYGAQGAEYGAQAGQLGLQSGAQAQQLANQIAGSAGGYGTLGTSYGTLGQQAGAYGQQLGTQQGGYYGSLGAGYGAQAAGLSPLALGYGQGAADIGMMGLQAQQYGQDIGQQSRGYAQQSADMGSLYGRMATDPSVYQQYMSPYQQAVIDKQIEAAQRQADIAAQSRQAAATRYGAYGGSRQAIENAEANKALASQIGNIQATGLQSAYQQAQANIAQRAQLGLQGLQGAQAGLGTALQGGQLGLSGIGQAIAGQQAGMSGVGQAGQLYGLGMQGAGMGLQGLQSQLAGTAQGMQGAGYGLQGAGMGLQSLQSQLAAGNLGLAGGAQGIQGLQAAMQGSGYGMQGAGVGLSGLQSQLAGTAQGMQGAGYGLQGVSGAQAGYGLAGQTAAQLGQLGSQQLAAQQGILGLQGDIGGQQQSYQQALINQAIQNYAAARESPYSTLSQYSALLRGYAVPGQTTTQYQAAPSPLSQLAGLGGTAASIYGLTQGKKAGGVIKSKDGIDELAIRRIMKQRAAA